MTNSVPVTIQAGRPPLNSARVNDLTRPSEPDQGGPGRVRHHGAEDVRLVQGVLRRDQQALGEIYRNHADALRSRPAVLGERTLAEEIVQEVFVRLWNAADRFDAERRQPPRLPPRPGARAQRRPVPGRVTAVA